MLVSGIQVSGCRSADAGHRMQVSGRRSPDAGAPESNMHMQVQATAGEESDRPGHTRKISTDKSSRQGMVRFQAGFGNRGSCRQVNRAGQDWRWQRSQKARSE